MYAIYIHSLKANETGKKEGWLKGLKTHTGREYEGLYCGKQRVEPIFAETKTQCKLWVNQDEAISYARRLACKFDVISYKRFRINPCHHLMKYKIEVVNVNTLKAVFYIDSWSYSDIE